MAYRFIIDITKKAMEDHPGAHVIKDSHSGDAVVALCPITEEDEPICEGQFSFAPLVQRALENEANAKATFAKISALVRTAFDEGRTSIHNADENSGDRAWANSSAKRWLNIVMLGTDEMPEHPMAGPAINEAVKSDLQVFISPDSSPLERIVAHGRLRMKGEI